MAETVARRGGLTVLPQDIPLDVIFEDAHLVALNKPAGMVVHPAVGHRGGTLVNALLHHIKGLSTTGGADRPGIVHRLDIGTSGMLVVARTEHAYHELVHALSQRDVGRVYRTLVWGCPSNPHGVIDAPIGRDHRDPMKMAVVVDGKAAFVAGIIEIGKHLS